LGGLLLAGLPVLLHFLVRKKPRTLLFPAFRFLVEKQRSNTRNLRLRHLLLLLFRIALVVLVCFALSRPRLFHESLGISRERPVALVLVFDTSLSMEYKSGDLTRLEFAKRRCLEFLDQLPEDCRVLVLDASDPVSFAREDWHKSLVKARERIQSLTARPQTAPVSRAIDEAMRRFDKLDDPSTESFPRVLCVFSDRTKSSWDSGPSRPPAENVKTLCFDVGVDDPADVAILAVELPLNDQNESRQVFSEGETIELRVVVKATGKEVEGEVTLHVNEKKTPQPFAIKAGEQTTLTFRIDTAKLSPGYYQAMLTLTPTDALPFNNQRFVTFQIADRSPVLVLADDLKQTRRFRHALDALGYAVTHKTATGDTTLAGYKTVFLVSVAAPADELWKALADYASLGNGVCIVPPGDDLRVKAYNGKAAKTLLPGDVKERIDSTGGVEWDLATNDLRHPFMRPFLGWLERGNVDVLRHPPRADKYWRIDVPASDNVVVRYSDESPAVVERLLGKGKVLLLTTPLDDKTTAWNKYRLEPTIFDFTLAWLCARHLVAGADNPKLNFEFGVGLPSWRSSEAVAFPKYFLTGDATLEIRLDGNGRWTGDLLSKPGNYALEGRIPDANKVETLWKFSVNAPATESDLTRLDESEIDAALGQGALVRQDARTPLLDSIGAHWTEPMELFPWLMLALLLFLALENLLANKFYRQEPQAC
jgi:hypothetical protein